jgi:hypothetical protein
VRQCAEAAEVGGIECAGLVTSCLGGELLVGAKFESAMAPATPGIQGREVGADDIGLPQKKEKRT